MTEASIPVTEETPPPPSVMREGIADLEARLAKDPRLASDIVTRPHPLIVMVVREELAVVFAPASLWDNGRELLVPYTGRFADSAALLFLLGRPRDPSIDQALARGLGGILAA